MMEDTITKVVSTIKCFDLPKQEDNIEECYQCHMKPTCQSFINNT